MNKTYRCRALSVAAFWAVLGGAFGAPGAWAADALNGKKLFLNGPVGGGLACARCHGASPASNAKNVLGGANQPGVIGHAIEANLGGMGKLYAGRLGSGEIADLAAFIGNPNVSGTPGASMNPAALAYPATALGGAAGLLATTLSNPGSAPLAIGSIGVTGAAAADYTVGRGSCAAGATLAAGASCTVQVEFRPGAAGVRTASLVIGHDATGGASVVALGGAGNLAPAPGIALSANALDFWPAATRTLTVMNSGQAPLAFSAIALEGPDGGAFALGGSCGSAAPLAAGASCTLDVAATRSGGPFSASLVLASNAANSRVAVALARAPAAPAPALAVSPGSLAFGTRTLGAPAASRQVRLTNSGGLALALKDVRVAGDPGITIASSSCAASLAPGEGCIVTLAFAPSAPVPAAATLSVTSNAAPLRLAISGAGSTTPLGSPALSEAGPLAFADTLVGKASAVHALTLSNRGPGALSITALALDGTQAADFVLGGSCSAGGVLAPGVSCGVEVGFKPTAGGQRSASMLLLTGDGARFDLDLAGTGLTVPGPTLSVTPQAIDFGSADVGGAAATRRITLTNTGGAPAVIGAASFSGPFALQAAGGDCPALPFTLAPGAACQLSVRFAPVGAGGASGALALAADNGIRLELAFSGVGVVPAAAPAQASHNTGGGGCSAIEGGTGDPVLAVLVLLSIGVLLWRRFVRKQEETP